MIVVIVLIEIGIFIRFYDLDWKFFWGEEIHTILYTAGFTETELINDIAGREIEIDHLNPEVRLITLTDLDKFQLPERNGDIFIYDLTPEIRKNSENLPGVRIEEVNADDRLWRLK
ncbi:MAG: hypothetical protein DHS20C13_03770 [Thermodesulfobacteriota bacterium]|nr:MAG: hypothetical protein DHS20C13_03770 [Thermodesulfobacteriota bacterium]